MLYMTTQEKVEALIEQAAELPEEAQAELVHSLVEMRSQHLGIYHLDEEERAALAPHRCTTSCKIERLQSKKATIWKGSWPETSRQ